MIILDTNVISEMMKEEMDSNVQAWLNTQNPRSIFTTTVTIMEIRYGILKKPDGRKKEGYKVAFDNIMATAIGPRVLSLDTNSAERAGAVAAETKMRGMNLGTADVQIAGIALASGFAVCSRDELPFKEAGVELINPFKYHN